MIVQCCICKRIEGVKCPKCGEMVAFIRCAGPELLKPYGEWVCSAGHHFMTNDGGISHGYCPFCFKQFKDQISLEHSFKCYNRVVDTR